MTVLGRLGARPTAAPFPGWVFGRPRKAGLAYFARMAAWKLALRSSRTIWVRTPWLYGTLAEMPLGSDIARCTWVTGCFEPNALDLLARLLRTGDTVIDIGANVGLYSIAAARLVGEEGHVVAVEPSSRERAVLRDNVALNDLHWVTIDDRALGAAAGKRVLRVTDHRHGGQNTLGSPVYSAVRVIGKEDVEVATLDSLVDGLAGKRVAVVKLDVEGAEHEVLRGATRVLTEHRPVILMELQERSLAMMGSSVAEVLKSLDGHAYRVYQYSDSAATTLVPLPRPPAASSQDVVALPLERPVPS